MRYIIDTCILVWILQGNTRALGGLSDIILNTKNDVTVSVASYWEIIIKEARGKIIIKDDILRGVEEAGIRWLDVKLLHVEHLQHLPALHNDPFDRIIMAQSIVEGCEVLTTDRYILQYNLKDQAVVN
ncbi:MAG: type II toxin-antitoxin system VapC family toxin [Proteobacteria bacterium]|nr:type II toxin-antitoxin system VapC family toxin [Pseudomonadota bacterium]